MTGVPLKISMHSTRFECWFRFSNGFYRRVQGDLEDIRVQLQGLFSVGASGSTWLKLRHMDQISGHFLIVGPCSDLKPLDELMAELKHR